MAVTKVDLVYIALNTVKRPCPCYHLHQGFPSSFLSQVVVSIELMVAFRQWPGFEVCNLCKLTPANNTYVVTV